MIEELDDIILNGYRLTDSDDIESFFWSIARGEQSLENIGAWLSKIGQNR